MLFCGLKLAWIIVDARLTMLHLTCQENSGVAARMRVDFQLSIEVHCLGHCLNLEVKRVSNVSRDMRNCIDASLEMIKLIKHSPKREKKLGKTIEFDFWTRNPNPTCRRHAGS